MFVFPSYRRAIHNNLQVDKIVRSPTVPLRLGPAFKLPRSTPSVRTTSFLGARVFIAVRDSTKLGDLVMVVPALVVKPALMAAVHV